ncbi:MAG: stage III sporulation protein AE [Halanaerobiales bacterium]
MLKIRCITTIIISVIILLFTLTTPSMSQGRVEAVNINQQDATGQEVIQQEDVILQQLDNLNLRDLQKEINRINDRVDTYLPEINLQDILIGFIRGELEVSWSNIVKTILKYLGKEVTANFNLLGQIIILSVISAVLSIFHQSFSSKTISNTANVIIFLIISVLILQAFNLAIQIGIETINTMVSFIQALLPILLSLLVSMGALTSAAIFHPLTLMIITVLSTSVKYIIFPMIFLSVVLNIVTRINLDFSLSRLAGLFKEISMGMLGLMFMLFIGGLLLQGGAAAITDSLSLRTAKYLTGTFVPVIGKIFSDAVDLIVGCSLIIKNGLNLFGMVVIIIIIAYPIVKIIALIFIYKLASAIVQPVADGRLVNILNDTGNSLIMVFVVVSAVSVMFFVVLTIIVGTANLTVMMR